MSTITNHIEEMNAALLIARTKVNALTDLIALGGFTFDEMRELEEDLSQSRIRMVRLEESLFSDANLLNTGYPAPLVFDTTKAIQKSFLDRIDRMEKVVTEFKEEPIIGADGGSLAFEAL